MGPVLGTTSSSTSSSSSATQTVEYDPNHQSGGSCNTSLAAFRTSTGETITGKIFRETDCINTDSNSFFTFTTTKDLTSTFGDGVLRGQVRTICAGPGYRVSVCHPVWDMECIRNIPNFSILYTPYEEKIKCLIPCEQGKVVYVDGRNVWNQDLPYCKDLPKTDSGDYKWENYKITKLHDQLDSEIQAVDEEPATEAEAEAEQVEEELDAELFDVAADAGIQAAFLAEDA